MHNCGFRTPDDLVVQKVLMKLRGAETPRPLLANLSKAPASLPRSEAFIARSSPS